MVPLIAYVRSYARRGTDFDIKLPESQWLNSLFHNANWAYLIAPRYHDQSTYSNEKHLPALSFTNEKTQTEVVDRIMDVLMSSLDKMERKSLAALEWSVSEITDNVLNHAQAAEGIVQASTFSESNAVEFVVADAGVGIPATLEEQDDAKALEKAIQEGVTRNSKTNAGNGLFGSYQIATRSGGAFELISGKAYLVSKSNEGLKLRNDHIPFRGTIVISKIDCSQPNVIEQALRFKNKIHHPPYDYLEKKYEKEGEDDFIFVMRKESSSFGSRESGKPIYHKLATLLRSSQGQRILIDFRDVAVISSSFADEVFGRLFVEFGPINFMSKIIFINSDDIISGLIDRAIMQRSAYDHDRSKA